MHTKKIKISTSKLLIFLLFADCTLIQIFTVYIVWKSLEFSLTSGIAPDFTPLTTLIGSVIGEAIGYAVYSLKAAKENTDGGIQYMLAQQQERSEDNYGE